MNKCIRNTEIKMAYLHSAEFKVVFYYCELCEL